MMYKFKALFVITCLICSLILSACKSQNSEAASKRNTQSDILSVNGVLVKPQPLDNVVRSSGTVLASESVDLVAEASGRIEKITFREGSHVKQHDLLVKINDDDLQAQLRKIELQIQLSSEQERRQKQLYDINGISQEQYDISLNQVNSYKADRDNLLAMIRKREVRAPFDGVIGLRYVSEGGYVSPTTHIASIQKINPLKVDFSIPEKYAELVSAGSPVQFISNETQQRFSGTLYAIEPKIDPDTRTLQLRALCNNKSEKIFPGAYVQIELQLKKIPNAIMVPTQAVVPAIKGQTIFVCKNGVAVSTPVNTGIRTSSEVQILNGLAAGDTVLTTGLMQLRPGVRVNVIIK